MYRFIAFVVFCILPYISFSQNYDVITFETAVTAPNNKAYSNTGVFSLNGYDWTLPGVYLGTPDAGDFKINDRSARVRRLNDASGANGYLEMQEDYPFGFDFFGFKAAMYGADAGGVLAVSYSTNGGSSWIGLDTFNIAPNNNPTLYEVHQHIYGNVRFRIEKLDNTASRINIDSIYCIPLAVPPDTLSVVRVSPTGSIHPATSLLEVQFNQHIEEGSGGALRLINKTTNAVTTYGINHPDVEFYEWHMRIHNVSLDPETDYYIVFDSTLVAAEYNGDFSDGIYDTTAWVINTTPSHLIFVEEDFSNCEQWELLGIFKQYSVLDHNRRWNCKTENNNTFLYMTGNTDSNTAIANEDWLVSYLNFDFGGNVPTLKFQERKVGTGNSVTRRLMYTTHFNINITTTSWHQLMTFNDDFVNNNWKEKVFTITDSAAINQPVTLAIVYENANDTVASAWEWQIDDFTVVIDTTVSIHDIKNVIPSVYVANPCVTDFIELNIYSNEPIEQAVFSVFDLMGRQLISTEATIKKGMQKHTIEGTKLTSGQYIIRIATPYGSIHKKIIIQR